MYSVRVFRFGRELGSIRNARVTATNVTGVLVNPTEEARQMLAKREFFVFVSVQLDRQHRNGIAAFRSGDSVTIEFYG